MRSPSTAAVCCRASKLVDQLRLRRRGGGGGGALAACRISGVCSRQPRWLSRSSRSLGSGPAADDAVYVETIIIPESSERRVASAAAVARSGLLRYATTRWAADGRSLLRQHDRPCLRRHHPLRPGRGAGGGGPPVSACCGANFGPKVRGGGGGGGRVTDWTAVVVGRHQLSNAGRRAASDLAWRSDCWLRHIVCRDRGWATRQRESRVKRCNSNKQQQRQSAAVADITIISESSEVSFHIVWLHKTHNFDVHKVLTPTVESWRHSYQRHPTATFSELT